MKVMTKVSIVEHQDRNREGWNAEATMDSQADMQVWPLTLHLCILFLTQKSFIYQKDKTGRNLTIQMARWSGSQTGEFKNTDWCM